MAPISNHQEPGDFGVIWDFELLYAAIQLEIRTEAREGKNYGFMITIVLKDNRPQNGIP